MIIIIMIILTSIIVWYYSTVDLTATVKSIIITLYKHTHSFVVVVDVIAVSRNWVTLIGRKGGGGRLTLDLDKAGGNEQSDKGAAPLGVHGHAERHPLAHDD